MAACAAQDVVRERPLEQAIEDGRAFLVRSQNPDGSWGSGRGSSGFDVMADVPGSHDAFRVGATALAVMALRELGEREASKKGLDYLVAYDGLRRANRMELYNVWGHTYALQVLARVYREEKSPDVRRAAERHLERLQMYETFTGGWNYYDFVYGTRTPSMEPTSFGTAAGLIALYEAREAGISVPEPLIKRALARLKECRQPDGSFLYGSDMRHFPQHLANRGKGSLGRTQSGHDALALWGSKEVGEKELRAGLDGFFRDHKFIEMGRKRQYPHEAWYFTSGYYYYFGHFHAARLIERLGDASYKAKLAACVLPYQEADGSWWDYRMWDYHGPYGTALALMTLTRTR
ncbi:MAG TPA: prenyltransferase/squalene oxidase repeat-containing protein [Planctomycetota bacterium]